MVRIQHQNYTWCRFCAGIGAGRVMLQRLQIKDCRANGVVGAGLHNSLYYIFIYPYYLSVFYFPFSIQIICTNYTEVPEMQGNQGFAGHENYTLCYTATTFAAQRCRSPPVWDNPSYQHQEENNMNRLKQLQQWICWNLKTKNGRATKVPCAAGGEATGTDPAHASTWVTWQEAVTASQARQYTGVGFVIPQGYFFLDVDHKELSDPLVQTLLKRFNTYAERSFSGNGLHIYGRCDLSRLPIQDGKLDYRYYTKNPCNGLELYIGGLTNRFAVFTGDAIQDVPLADCTDAILTTLEQNMRRETTVPATIVQLDNSEVTEEDIFEIVTGLRAAKNGDKFCRLYDEGDISGYGSHSEADAGLCAIIAFRAGPNPELVDAIFRRSALYREEKWERDDYRESTIRCGIEACRGTFHGGAIGKPSFIITHPRTGADTVCATRLAQHIRQTMRYFFVQDHAMSAARCYVYQDGAYRLMSRTMMLGIIKQYITDYDEYLVKTSILGEVYELLLTDNIFVSEDALNADENLINFQNGLLRLSDMTLLPHTPDIFSTIQLPCEWRDTPQPTPVYDTYMDTLTGGDKAIQQLLEEFCGCACPVSAGGG